MQISLFLQTDNNKKINNNNYNNSGKLHDKYAFNIHKIIKDSV